MAQRQGSLSALSRWSFWLYPYTALCAQDSGRDAQGLRDNRHARFVAECVHSDRAAPRESACTPCARRKLQGALPRFASSSADSFYLVHQPRDKRIPGRSASSGVSHAPTKKPHPGKHNATGSVRSFWTTWTPCAELWHLFCEPRTSQSQ